MNEWERTCCRKRRKADSRTHWTGPQDCNGCHCDKLQSVFPSRIRNQTPLCVTQWKGSGKRWAIEICCLCCQKLEFGYDSRASDYKHLEMIIPQHESIALFHNISSFKEECGAWYFFNTGYGCWWHGGPVGSMDASGCHSWGYELLRHLHGVCVNLC